MLRLPVFGHFRLLDEKGHNIAPAGQKDRAIIMLLATAPQMARTRDWLQDKLWSDRSKEQASRSLRTSLANIRRALGRYECHLKADRTRIWFDQAALELDFSRVDGIGQISHSEPFEDLNINDAEFENLIRDIRATVAGHEYSTPNEPNKRELTVFVQYEVHGGVLAKMAAEFLTGQIRAALDLTGNIDTVILPTPRANFAGAPTIRMFLAESDGELFLSCRLHELQEGRIIWSAEAVHCGSLSSLYASDELAGIVLQVVDRTVDEIIEIIEKKQHEHPLVLENIAKQLIFNLDRESFEQADLLFCRAFEIEPRGRFLAWRAFLRNLAFFQHRTFDFLTDAELMETLSQEAIRHDPHDPVVQAFVSQLDYIHQGNLRASLAMVESAVAIRSNDPLLIAILSNALAANGSVDRSYSAAKRALALSRGKPWHYFFHHFACMSAAALGKYELAMTHARTGLRFRPEFVSIRRYEVALSLQSKDNRSLEASIKAMRLIEPEFQTSTLLEPDYPVTTLRRLPLIDAVS